MPPPSGVYISLLQHRGVEALPAVKAGDYVSKGQLIGKMPEDCVSANVFTGVSGTVREIKKMRTASGETASHVIIDADGKDNELLLPKLDNPTAQQILQRIKDAGIVGMGGASFPTHEKYTIKGCAVDTLIINGAECEPYITCDYRVMIEHHQKVVQGIMLFAKILNVSNIIIGIEDNKQDAIDAFSAYPEIKVVPLKTKYPQGAEKQLIYSTTRRKVRNGTLPQTAGCLVSNVQTAFSVYEAVYEGKTCHSRVITVSGQAAANKGNYLIPTGTLISDIAKFVNVDADAVYKMVAGGPMMGVSHRSADVSVTKGTTSILFLTEEEVNTQMADPCINCGRCARACPHFLMPMYIDVGAIARDFAMAKKYGALDCIECGCCAYVCPTKRPLVQSIRLAKKMIKYYNI